jgi:predicted DNA-binding protein YlxM (UPF0122 family)
MFEISRILELVDVATDAGYVKLLVQYRVKYCNLMGYIDCDIPDWATDVNNIKIGLYDKIKETKRELAAIEAKIYSHPHHSIAELNCPRT